MRTTAKFLTAAAATVALVTGAGLAAADHGVPSVEPEHVEAMILPGDSLDVDKTVHTSEIPPSPEIYFLVDTTGSMGPVIDQVKTNIGAIVASIDAATSNSATYGIGEYKDFPYDSFAYQNLVAIGGDFGSAVAALTAGGGADGSEGQFFALDQIAKTTVAGFTGAGTQIVVWIGDAPAHDPVCSAISGLGYDITEASVTADLQSAGLTVVAVSTTTGYPLGLDDDPTADASNYSGTCTIGGAAGQATRITGATGGVALLNVPPENVASAILEAIGAVEVDVSMTSNCDLVTGGVITTTFAPASQTVTSGDSTTFTETISVAPDAPGGYYWCTDSVLLNGEPMLDELGEVAVVETKRILVPENFVTGGGQISVGKGKSKVIKLNFGGNAGYMPDGALVGHWHFDFKDQGVKVNTTEITALQFYDFGDPAPPEADANAAYMEAVARVNVDNTGWVDGCSLLAYFEDNGEPQMDTVGGWEVTCTGFAFAFDDLTGGNIQIHDGTK